MTCLCVVKFASAYIIILCHFLCTYFIMIKHKNQFFFFCLTSLVHDTEIKTQYWHSTAAQFLCTINTEDTVLLCVALLIVLPLFPFRLTGYISILIRIRRICTWRMGQRTAMEEGRQYVFTQKDIPSDLIHIIIPSSPYTEGWGNQEPL